MTGDTIYALSTGSPPAAIAVVRISGPAAADALRVLAGRLPEPRRASAATLRHPVAGEVLDRGLMVFFPGPATATGEDVAELHLHGGRAVVAAILSALSGIDGLRHALPGEFTRRAFENGRIDLAEAEGLADLLNAETEAQRRAAAALAGGVLSQRVKDWEKRILSASAELEARIDFADEVQNLDNSDRNRLYIIFELADEIEQQITAPAIERLRDGVRLVIAGPPNAGKSTLLNAMAGREAAITSARPGTTRDVVEAPTAISGAAFLLIDTAGLRETEDEIEALGVERARNQIGAAEIVLWLGEREDAPGHGDTIVVHAKCDLREPARDADIRLSAITGEGMDDLYHWLMERSQKLARDSDELAINERHRAALRECLVNLKEAQVAQDPVIAAEALRQARRALDRVTGRSGVEDMLDSLFGRFCIGK